MLNQYAALLGPEHVALITIVHVSSSFMFVSGLKLGYLLLLAGWFISIPLGFPFCEMR